MMLASDWQARHPFTVGQTVYAREAHVLQSFGLFLTPGQAYRVRMRGEDAHGLWLAVDGVSEHLPERLFTHTATPQVVTLVEAPDDEEVA